MAILPASWIEAALSARGLSSDTQVCLNLRANNQSVRTFGNRLPLEGIFESLVVSL